jgi:hypothetical protein
MVKMMSAVKGSACLWVFFTMGGDGDCKQLSLLLVSPQMVKKMTTVKSSVCFFCSPHAGEVMAVKKLSLLLGCSPQMLKRGDCK